MIAKAIARITHYFLTYLTSQFNLIILYLYSGKSQQQSSQGDSMRHLPLDVNSVVLEETIMVEMFHYANQQLHWLWKGVPCYKLPM